jgi:hypothetical protein
MGLSFSKAPDESVPDSPARAESGTRPDSASSHRAHAARSMRGQAIHGLRGNSAIEVTGWD